MLMRSTLSIAFFYRFASRDRCCGQKARISLGTSTVFITTYHFPPRNSKFRRIRKSAERYERRQRPKRAITTKPDSPEPPEQIELPEQVAKDTFASNGYHFKLTKKEQR